MALIARPAGPADAAEGGRVLVSAFNRVFQRHGFPPPFPSLESGQNLVASYVAYAETRGVVLEGEGGKLVSIAFVHPRRRTAGIGPVAVEPHAQSRGVGLRLMEALLAAAPGVESFRLTQDAFNNVSFSLYHKLGFVVRDVMLGLERPAEWVPDPSATVRELGVADLAEVAALDTRLTGIERPHDLTHLLHSGHGFVLEREGAHAGYLLHRTIGRHLMIGPAAAAADDDLYALITAALAANPGATATMRFLASRPNLLNRLFETGFRIAHLGNYMVRGPWERPPGAQVPAAYPEAL
jgi:GNAT superfamily N-acetyltransferase